MKYKIEAENIKCGGCMNKIKAPLMQMERVKQVTSDKEMEIVTTETTSDIKLFIQKINESRYYKNRC